MARLGLLAAALLCGCTTPRQASSVAFAGFLSDYSKLRPGAEGQALWVYIDPAADFSRYDGVKVLPVVVLAPRDSEFDPAEARRLARAFESSLRQALIGEFRLLDVPTSNTLLVRAALADVGAANVPLNAVTTVVPVGRAVSAASSVTTGSHTFVGKASAELELLEAATGRQLAAGVDRRTGAKSVRQLDAKWRDVQAAMDLWAQRLVAVMRSRSGIAL